MNEASEIALIAQDEEPLPLVGALLVIGLVAGGIIIFAKTVSGGGS